MEVTGEQITTMLFGEGPGTELLLNAYVDRDANGDAEVVDLDSLALHVQAEFPTELETEVPTSEPVEDEPVSREPAIGMVSGGVQAYLNQQEAIPPYRGS